MKRAYIFFGKHRKDPLQCYTEETRRASLWFLQDRRVDDRILLIALVCRVCVVGCGADGWSDDFGFFLLGRRGSVRVARLDSPSSSLLFKRRLCRIGAARGSGWSDSCGYGCGCWGWWHSSLYEYPQEFYFLLDDGDPLLGIRLSRSGEVVGVAVGQIYDKRKSLAGVFGGIPP